MSSKLPAEFTDKMKDLLGRDEFERFLDSYDRPRAFGIRVNTGKIGVQDFVGKSPFTLSRVPWSSEGFYYEEGERPGKHPYYHAGLYYIQEPSAMAPVELLDVRPGERVLDLCAAPGGKSTQIAAKLQGEGVLVVNDNHSDRVKALVKNLELFGVRNAVVLNEKPERMLIPFAGYFDKILIDAPCSGEGMFRKEEDMMAQWHRHSVTICSAMQRELLGQAARMLAPGGTIVYSTCTFSPEEDEAQIAEFLDKHEDFEVVEVSSAYFSKGRPDWLRAPWVDGDAYSSRASAAVAGTVRLWPHHLRGEGHFAAVLRRRAAPSPDQTKEGIAAHAGESYDGAVMSEVLEKGRLNAPHTGTRGNGADSSSWAGRGYAEERSRGEGACSWAGRGHAEERGRGEGARSWAGRGHAEERVHGEGAARSLVERGYAEERSRGEGARSSAARERAVAARPAGKRSSRGEPLRKDRARTAAETRAGGSLEPLEAFERELLKSSAIGAAGRLVCYGEHAYASPADLPELHGLKVVRPGWYIGALHRGRFEPSHALAMGLRMSEAKRALSLALGDARALRYLKGETLEVAESEIIRDPFVTQAAKGYCLVCIDGFPVGWGKWNDGMLKNEYPPGWRWT